MAARLKPPPTLEACRVLKYAIVNGAARYSGHSNLFRGEKEVGPVPCLAICEATSETDYFLLHCENDWTVLGIQQCRSIEEAQASAEQAYEGVGSLWLDAQVSKQEADEHRAELWRETRCTFCGRIPPDFENPRFIEKRGSWICESCVRSCHELLQESDEAK